MVHLILVYGHSSDDCRILTHSTVRVLRYGMGLADLRSIREAVVELPLTDASLVREVEATFASLSADAKAEVVRNAHCISHASASQSVK